MTLKVKDLIEKLKEFDPEAELYCGGYYYDIKESYRPLENFGFLSTTDIFRQPEGNVLLIDTNQYPETQEVNDKWKAEQRAKGYNI